MFLGYHEPHTPILEYPDHIAKFRDKAAKLPPGPAPRTERGGQTRTVQNDAPYGSEVAGLDAFVGSLLEKLDKSGLAENTIVIFFSDNGGLSTKAEPGPASNEPLRAGKGWLYEGGIRVPLIVRAPGITKPGAVTDVPVISTDLYPTLLALAGLPARPEQHRDGISIAPVLRGEPAPVREALFWHYPHYHGSTWAPGGAMLAGGWKLIEFFEEGTAELYDLTADLSERRNLAAAEPARLAVHARPPRRLAHRNRRLHPHARRPRRRHPAAREKETQTARGSLRVGGGRGDWETGRREKGERGKGGIEPAGRGTERPRRGTAGRRLDPSARARKVHRMNTNPVCWFEIYVQDMARAKAFYETVLATKLEELPGTDFNMWAFPMEMSKYGAPGALIKMDGCQSGGGGTLVYFACDDCATEAARVPAAGGTVVKPKFSIGQYGHIALVTDTEGNTIGLHSQS